MQHLSAPENYMYLTLNKESEKVQEALLHGSTLYDDWLYINIPLTPV